MDDRSALGKWIVKPIEDILGTRLRSVVYIVLNYDGLDFDADAPNEYGGCQAVYLSFEGGELELDWDWQAEFRDREKGLCYHLTALDKSVRLGQLTEEEYVRLEAIPAIETKLWQVVLGESIADATVWGFELADGRKSPQAVTLIFPSEQITIAIGDTSSGWLGDGDELLVFGAREWEEQAAARNKFSQIWQAKPCL